MHRDLRWLPFALILSMLLGSGAATAIAQESATPTVTESGVLVVADPIAETLYIYSTPAHEIVAEFDGIVMNTHAGYLPLEDGRLLLIDDGQDELVAIDLLADGGPSIDGVTPVPDGVSHIAADPAGQFAAVGSSDPRAPITLIDLDSYTARAIDIEAGEVGLMLGSDPLTLFHRNDVLAQIEAYPVEGFTTGSTTPTGVVATGAFGHGEAILHDSQLIAAATDDGFDIVAFEGDRLDYVRTLPWDAGDRSGGRAYFARVAPDGEHVISYIANRGTEETPWGDWENDVYIANPATGDVIRTSLAPGLVFRFAQADDVALFFNMHPDGDNAFVVDTNASSPTFGSVIATIPLDPLSNAVGADESPWEGESRVAAIAPDGSVGYVSAGGDSAIVVIDIVSGTVAGTIDTPTALSGGGYLLALTPGQPVVDTIGR